MQPIRQYNPRTMRVEEFAVEDVTKQANSLAAQGAQQAAAARASYGLPPAAPTPQPAQAQPAQAQQPGFWSTLGNAASQVGNAAYNSAAKVGDAITDGVMNSDYAKRMENLGSSHANLYAAGGNMIDAVKKDQGVLAAGKQLVGAGVDAFGAGARAGLGSTIPGMMALGPGAPVQPINPTQSANPMRNISTAPPQAAAPQAQLAGPTAPPQAAAPKSFGPPAPAASAAKPATPPPFVGPPSPADINAQFRKAHGTNYDPHSSMDRRKLQQMNIKQANIGVLSFVAFDGLHKEAARVVPKLKNIPSAKRMLNQVRGQVMGQVAKKTQELGQEGIKTMPELMQTGEKIEKVFDGLTNPAMRRAANMPALENLRPEDLKAVAARSPYKGKSRKFEQRTMERAKNRAPKKKHVNPQKVHPEMPTYKGYGPEQVLPQPMPKYELSVPKKHELAAPEMPAATASPKDPSFWDKNKSLLGYLGLGGAGVAAGEYDGQRRGEVRGGIAGHGQGLLDGFNAAQSNLDPGGLFGLLKGKINNESAASQLSDAHSRYTEGL